MQCAGSWLPGKFQGQYPTENYQYIYLSQVIKTCGNDKLFIDFQKIRVLHMEIYKRKTPIKYILTLHKYKSTLNNILLKNNT